jgi:hypothetical protein
MVRFLSLSAILCSRRRLQFVEVDKLQDASLTRVSWLTSELTTENLESTNKNLETH